MTYLITKSTHPGPAGGLHHFKGVVEAAPGLSPNFRTFSLVWSKWAWAHWRFSVGLLNHVHRYKSLLVSEASKGSWRWKGFEVAS